MPKQILSLLANTGLNVVVMDDIGAESCLYWHMQELDLSLRKNPGADLEVLRVSVDLCVFDIFCAESGRHA